MEFESTPLFRNITKATKYSLHEAWRLIGSMSDDQLRMRSPKDKSTFLHQVVMVAPEVHKRYQSLTLLVPVVYRLAYRGVNVNAQNEHGNTALHLACIRPHADDLCPHLIRIGVDPCIQNKKQCRIIHTLHHHKCTLVKGQTSAKSGLWNAVEKEDVRLVERLLRSWCRVDVRRNKSLQALAEETANVQLIKLLQRFRWTSELAIAALACEAGKTRELIKSNHITVDLTQRDEAVDVPKPLVVAVSELGDVGQDVVRELTEAGAAGCGEYQEPHRFAEVIRDREMLFEHTDFFLKIEEGSLESLRDALEVIKDDKLDVKLTSCREGSRGWTYLHYVVDRYIKLASEDEEMARLLIRAIYRLAFAGCDVNARDAAGNTALIHVAVNGLNQNLLTHLIRVGADPSLADVHGRAVNEEVYEDKGKLVYDTKYRVADLPGLWVAVASDDVSKTERWLKSWCRVNTFKGDRRLVDVARALKRQQLVRLLEEYEHINEFVSATFACDMKRMMDILALGKGKNKVNTIDDFFHVGFTWDRHAEFMPRPIIVSAMELCTPQVVDFLLNFGADLSREHEEGAPCGPVAFWAFRDHVCNDNALVVAKHADVNLRDEEGATLLHKAIQKRRKEGKEEVIQTLLDRGINLAARDGEGSTARDYITIHDVDDGDHLRRIIDDHVLELTSNDQHYQLETLLLDAYDHVMDIRGTKKNKTAREIAEVKEYKEMLELFDDWESYKKEIDLLHTSAQAGDLLTVSKLSGEKRCAWSRDKAGRTLLHNAVLFEHTDMVRFLCEQFPNLINTKDNYNRTPLHLCVCHKDRHLIWPILQDAEADQTLIDTNNMSVYEYVRELENPVPTKDRPRGRRWRDYRPSECIAEEQQKQYGQRALRHELRRHLLTSLSQGAGLAEVKAITDQYPADLSVEDLDIDILVQSVDKKRQEVAKHIINTCGARAHVDVSKNQSLKSYAKTKDLTELVDFIRKCPKPLTEELLAQQQQQQEADTVEVKSEVTSSSSHKG